MPPSQVVLTIAKRLRAYRLYHRRLLGEIARVATRTVTAAIRTLTGERDLAVGIVACLQAHGSRANWHPHLHLLVTDGGFRPDGTFVTWPAHDTARLTEAFRRAVLRLFVRVDLFDEDQAAGMLTWPHSGFHVHTAVVRRVAIGSSFANAARRASATAICAFNGANTAKSGANSAVNVGDRSSAAIRVGTHALALVGTRSPSRRTRAFASAMSRVRVPTSASRTASSARTCRRASERREAGRHAPVSHASIRVRASRVSVLVRRERLAYIGPSFGSATMTSWPSDSTWRATHSRSVLASSRMRASGRSPSTAVHRSRLVAIRRAVIVPSSAVMHSGLSRLCRSRPMISVAIGLPICAPSSDGQRVDRGGTAGISTLPWRSSRRFIPTIS